MNAKPRKCVAHMDTMGPDYTWILLLWWVVGFWGFFPGVGGVVLFFTLACRTFCFAFLVVWGNSCPRKQLLLNYRARAGMERRGVRLSSLVEPESIPRRGGRVTRQKSATRAVPFN